MVERRKRLVSGNIPRTVFDFRMKEMRNYQRQNRDLDQSPDLVLLNDKDSVTTGEFAFEQCPNHNYKISRPAEQIDFDQLNSDASTEEVSAMQNITL